MNEAYMTGCLYMLFHYMNAMSTMYCGDPQKITHGVPWWRGGG